MLDYNSKHIKINFCPENFTCFFLHLLHEIIQIHFRLLLIIKANTVKIHSDSDQTAPMCKSHAGKFRGARSKFGSETPSTSKLCVILQGAKAKK